MEAQPFDPVSLRRRGSSTSLLLLVGCASREGDKGRKGSDGERASVEERMAGAGEAQAWPAAAQAPPERAQAHWARLRVRQLLTVAVQQALHVLLVKLRLLQLLGRLGLDAQSLQMGKHGCGWGRKHNARKQDTSEEW